jgi:hypothetical protein
MALCQEIDYLVSHGDLSRELNIYYTYQNIFASLVVCQYLVGKCNVKT